MEGTGAGTGAGLTVVFDSAPGDASGAMLAAEFLTGALAKSSKVAVMS